jgi:colanic acid biosynthesis protein WcaH
MPTSFLYPYGGNAAFSARRSALDGIWMRESAKGECADESDAPLLDAETFADIVANAPLIAFDLIVEDREGQALLGLRRNPPAQGYWFVPGGRIRKGETLDIAFSRITCEELGEPIARSKARFIDVFEHFYDTNFRGTAGAATHYVVHAYRLRLDRDALRLPAQQHSRYTWMSPEQARQRADVHPYTQAYFRQARFQD